MQVTIEGQLINTFKTPAKTDTKTGEIYPASDRIQVLCQEKNANGVRFELHTLKVTNPDSYAKLLNKTVRVACGTMVNGNRVMFFATKGAEPELVSDLKKAA